MMKALPVSTFLILFLISVHDLVAQSHFEDTFSSKESLNNWEQLEIDNWTSKIKNLTVENGTLVYEPKSSGWFEDNFAGFLYREIEGDFELTTKVKADGIDSDLPQTAFSLGGLFIRQPRSFTSESWERGKENWMFYSIGSASEPGKPQFELKSTYNSKSTIKILPAKDKWVELKIVRIDEVFTLLHKFEEEKWVILDQFIRPDFPKTLQVGITAYSDWASVAEVYPDFENYNQNGTPQDHSDFVAIFDYISILPAPVEKSSPIANFTGQQILDAISARP